MQVDVPVRNWVLPRPKPKEPLVKNSWEGLIDGFAAGDMYGTGPSIFASGPTSTIASPAAFSAGIHRSPMSLQLMDLSFGYMSYGVVQTLIDEPVDDAFKGGIQVKCAELDDDDLEELHRVMRKNRDLHNVKQGLKWGRLFGGAGLIIATDQDPMTPLDVDAIGIDQPLSFLPSDRWELMISQVDSRGYAVPRPYTYYGEQIDYSRVIRIKGREAPSRIRSLLQGWGMSELERCLNDINFFYKLQRVIFELVDESKIDVYKLQELNNMLGSSQGTQAAVMRIMFANWVKNYKAALVLDKEDDYEQKVQAFSGLADILEQARINISGATRMPVNKLFGMAATGFASGEDAMENYNAMVEADIREPSFPMLDDIFALRMKQVFGYIPNFSLSFKPLRILDPEAEERIKTSKQNRVIQLRQIDQISGQEADEILHKEELLDIDTEVGQGLRDPAPGADEPQNQPDEGEDGKKDKPEPKAKNAQEEKRRKYEWLKTEARRGRGFRMWAQGDERGRKAA